MERRFEERKREIEQDAMIDKKALAGSIRWLQQFGVPYFQHFRRSETRQNAQFFLEGLLSDLPRKNVESIAYRYEQDRNGLPRFIGQTDGDNLPLLHRLAEQAAAEIGEDEAFSSSIPAVSRKMARNRLASPGNGSDDSEKSIDSWRMLQEKNMFL